ncbi:hypothetical protein [Streptomyces sp. NPDC001933]|uniref:hypothetical protein n=1 Tax=Streptomyces sp. NPDC001933 TaxID=3364626 RepID=UPI0036C3D66B
MSRHVGFRAITLLREIHRRCGVTRLADLTAEQVRDLPPDLAALLGESFDPALITERPMPLSAFGDLWSTLVTEGVEFLDSLPPGQGTTLSYEQLLDDPTAELTRLARFIGITPDLAWAKAAASLIPTRRGSARALAAGQRAELDTSCAPGTRALALAGTRPDRTSAGRARCGSRAGRVPVTAALPPRSRLR